MGNSWNYLPFTEAVTVNPPVSLNSGEVYPFVEMKAVDPSQRGASESEFREFKGGGARFIPYDTLMARITPCLENGKIARYIPSSAVDTPAFGSTEFIVIRGRDGVTDNDYAYYLTQWKEFRYFAISQMTGSSGRQRVPVDSLAKFVVPIPENLNEQRAIAHILGSLDDKIELNHRMNQTLEAMARAIFKSWFVDFDPVRAKAEGRPTGLPDDIESLFPDSFEDSEIGEIPKGWKIVTFEELIDAKQGKYIPKNKMTDLPSAEYAYPVWGGNGIRGYAATFMYKEPVVVLTCRGSNCGRIDLTESPACISNIAFACSSKYGSVNFINVYLVYSSLTDTITGSAQPQITYTSLRNKQMHFPVHKKVCDAYSDYIDRLYDMIRGNNRQSTTLASLRDTLLPKLMSGELRVPDAEKFIEEADL